MDYIQVDNFFENVDDIRNIALSYDYEQSSENTGWKGYRKRITNSDIIHYIESKLVGIDKKFKDFDFDIFFHYTTKSTKSLVENFDTDRLHKDLTEWAGVIYLHPSPPLNSGTTLHFENTDTIKKIENEYNKFIFYKGDILHGILDTFGDNVENSRLTITIFGNNKKRKGII